MERSCQLKFTQPELLCIHFAKWKKAHWREMSHINRLLTFWITVPTKLPYRAESPFRGLSSHHYMVETQNSGCFWLSVHFVLPRRANRNAPDSPVTSKDSSSVAAEASQRFFLFFALTHLSPDAISSCWWEQRDSELEGLWTPNDEKPEIKINMIS